MNPEELLLELRDIEIPGEPGWWLIPPAWQLIFALTAVTIAAVCWYSRHRRRNRSFHEATLQLQQIRRDYQLRADSRATLQSLSAWLKRVAMAAFPDQRIAALSGRAWFEFLCRSTSKRVFDPGLQPVLSVEVYRESVDLDLNPAIDACERWLAAVRSSLGSRGDPDASV